MKEINTEITVPIYRCTLRLVVAGDNKRLSELCETMWGEADKNDAIHRACTMNNIGKWREIVILFDGSELCNSVIAHEAAHAADFIIERTGAEANGANKEPRAYLLQWIVDWVDRKLAKAGIKL